LEVKFCGAVAQPAASTDEHAWPLSDTAAIGPTSTRTFSSIEDIGRLVRTHVRWSVGDRTGRLSWIGQEVSGAARDHIGVARTNQHEDL